MIEPSGQTGEKGKISVWLDDNNDKKLKAFRCVVCGKVVFEYYSSVRILIPGATEVQRNPKVIQCHGTATVVRDGRVVTTGCRTKYWVE